MPFQASNFGLLTVHYETIRLDSIDLRHVQSLFCSRDLDRPGLSVVGFELCLDIRDVPNEMPIHIVV